MQNIPDLTIRKHYVKKLTGSSAVRAEQQEWQSFAKSPVSVTEAGVRHLLPEEFLQMLWLVCLHEGGLVEMVLM